MTTDPESVIETEKAADASSAGVIRGPDSWAILYVLVALAISIEGNFIEMLPTSFPLGHFPWNFFFYLVLAIGTFFLFTACGRLQDKVLAYIQKEQSTER